MQLHPPHLLRAWPIAEGLERDLHFDGPAALESPRADIPHRVPVTVGTPFVRESEVAERTQGIGIEGNAIAPVEKRVEDRPEHIVFAKLARVSPHLVRHPVARWRRVPHPGAHIDLLRVEQDPGLGLLGCRLPLIGLLLDEVSDRRKRLIDRLIKLPIELDGFS